MRRFEGEPKQRAILDDAFPLDPPPHGESAQILSEKMNEISFIITKYL